MHKMIMVVSLLILALLLPMGVIYAQDSTSTKSSKSSSTEFSIKISTIPSMLVSNSEGFLTIQAYYKDEPTPLVMDILDIRSSEPDILSVDKDSIERVGDMVLVRVIPLKSGSTNITVITKDPNLKSSTEIKVYDAADKPVKLAIVAKPSSFSYIGPHNGYVSIQLLNSLDEPIIADKDYDIIITSSNRSILDLNTMVKIKKGENNVHIPFNLNPENGGNVIITASYNDITASTTITNDGIKGQVLKLYAMKVIPASKGQIAYAFVQLQDSNGRVLYADRDIDVEVRANTHDIIGGRGTINKGESTAIIKLIVNTDTPCNDDKECITLTAKSKDMVSNNVNVLLREPIIEDYTSRPKSINNIDQLKIYAKLYPDDIPIVADGKSKVIGALQLVTYNNKEEIPVIAYSDTMIDLVSDDKTIIMDSRVTIPKGRNMELVNANLGYNAGDVTLKSLADYVENNAIRLSIQGHKDVKMYAEPLIYKVPSSSIGFPYIIYFKDSDGNASYAIDDINIRINGGNVIVKGLNSIEKGGSNIVVNITSINSRSDLHIDGVGLYTRYELYESVTPSARDKARLEINIPDTMTAGSRYVASIQLLYKGIPLRASDDTKVVLFSISDIINIPDNISIKNDKYFTLFTIEANRSGTADLTVLADGFDPIDRKIKVVDDRLSISINADKNVSRMDIFDVTLSVKYADTPLNNMGVKWSSDLAVLTSIYDSSTDPNGIAKAKFLAYKEGIIKVTAIVNGYGIERSASINIDARNKISDNINSANNDTIITNDTIIALDGSANENNIDIFTQLRYNLSSYAEYIMMIPAIAGIISWLINKKRKINR
jgi:hypothetical protein